MPIWFAYILGPVLLLLGGGYSIPQSPGISSAINVAFGLMCAAVLHAYIVVKRRIRSGDRRNK
jgi:hypothetical protein